MPYREVQEILPELHALARRTGELSLLVLFGSRARGDTWRDSDWDFAYLADGAVDRLALMAALAEIVANDRVDLVDLRHAGGLVRFRVARDGRLVYEAEPGAFDRFRFATARFWFDAEPVLMRGYDEILENLA